MPVLRKFLYVVDRGHYQDTTNSEETHGADKYAQASYDCLVSPTTYISHKSTQWIDQQYQSKASVWDEDINEDIKMMFVSMDFECLASNS